MIDDDRLELGGEVRETFGQGFSRVGFQLTVGEVRQAVAIGADQSPAGRAEPGIEAEDDQPSFSSSSSGTL
jgi:hypothetical protein